MLADFDPLTLMALLSFDSYVLRYEFENENLKKKQ